jgi:peroxiredoxin
MTFGGTCAAEERSVAVPELSLPDQHGQFRSLAEFQSAPAMVVAFLGTECPLAQLYGRKLGDMAREFGPNDVSFVGIDSNRQDTLTELRTYAARAEIEFPILIDAEQAALQWFGAVRTPEVFVLDRHGVIRYRGRVDDQYGIGIKRLRPQREDLREALEELLSGRPVSVPQTPTAGCLISRRSDAPPQGEITYASHIARIVHRRCLECHREGEVAPFSLARWEDVQGWESMIAEVVSEDRMPPWSANPEHGRFRNDARLTPEEKQLLLTWIENGCPQGDPAQIPDPPTFVTGWRISEPDLVIPMRDEPYAVPASGVVKYQYFEVDPGFTEDQYVAEVEARPGNPEVVHHIIAFVKPPGSADVSLGQMLVGYAPGSPPLVFPHGTASVIPRGSKLLFELHYTPNGKATTDRSYIGLKLTKPELVQRQVRSEEILENDFRIPPGAADHRVTASRKLPKAIDLLTLTPHMHVRGKSFRYEATYPDGRREVLLDVPRYDFNWQLRYELAEPKRLPRGTVISCTAVFDNSAANPNNPDPTKTVRWGDQSWEEMMIGFVTYVMPDRSDRSPQ